MLKSGCRHCFALREGKDGEWECDELDKPIKDIKECPEQSSKGE